MMTSLDVVERVVREIVEDYVSHNCVYLELRSTPKRFGGTQTLEEYIRRVASSMERAEEAFRERIKVRYVVSISRHGSVEQAEQILQAVLNTPSKYVVGLELSGDPRTGAFEDFLPVFRRGRAAGLRVSLHCGEIQE